MTHTDKDSLSKAARPVPVKEHTIAISVIAFYRRCNAPPMLNALQRGFPTLVGPVRSHFFQRYFLSTALERGGYARYSVPL